MELTTPIQDQRWTREEDTFLKNNWRTQPMSVILQNLPNRTYDAIRSRAAIKRWTGRFENGFKSGNAPLPDKPKTVIIEERKLLRIKGGRAWSKPEIEYLKNNYHLPIKKMQEVLLGRTYNAILAQAIKQGCPKHVPDWTKTELKNLQKHYPVSNKEQMLKLLPQRKWTAIKNHAQKLKIRQNHSYAFMKYSVNIDFFKTWSHDMAYVLGFIFADGHIREYKHKKQRGVLSKSFGITQKDPTILEEIRRAIKFDGVIHRKNGGFCDNAYQLNVYNSEMVRDLIKRGVQYRKSLIMQFPKDIPDKYLGDWVRGYFDGDGCVRHLSKTHLDMTFTSGSEQFLTDLNKHLHKTWGTTNREIKHPNKDPTVHSFVLRYNKADQAIFHRRMYHREMGNLYLERKKKVFDDIFGGI